MSMRRLPLEPASMQQAYEQNTFVVDYPADAYGP